MQTLDHKGLNSSHRGIEFETLIMPQRLEGKELTHWFYSHRAIEPEEMGHSSLEGWVADPSQVYKIHLLKGISQDKEQWKRRATVYKLERKAEGSVRCQGSLVIRGEFSCEYRDEKAKEVRWEVRCDVRWGEREEKGWWGGRELKVTQLRKWQLIFSWITTRMGITGN